MTNDANMGRKFRLPTEIPIEEYPSPEEFIEEAVSCVEEAEKRGIILRIMGGMAIYMHSRQYEDLWRRLGRLGKRVFTDIDFASYSKFRSEIMKFLEERGYFCDPRLLWHHGKRRLIYFGNRIPMVEVFFDKLEMNHTIDFRGRLEADKPTIPLAELLLEKLQIVHINEKDIKDVIVLLRAHDVGEGDDEVINLKRLADAGLTSDWGFYYTVTTNLKKIKEKLNEYDALSDEDRRVVKERIDNILDFLEKAPKTMGWKLRAKIGTKKKWYNDVEDWNV